MSATDVRTMERSLSFVYGEPKAAARSDYRGSFPILSGQPEEPIDFDWWEPTTEWRRENARHVEWFGGESFGRPSPPVEGPNNPDRLARELEDAEDDLRSANGE